MSTQAANAGLIFLLAVLTLLEVVQVWHVLVIAFLSRSTAWTPLDFFLWSIEACKSRSGILTGG